MRPTQKLSSVVRYTVMRQFLSLQSGAISFLALLSLFFDGQALLPPRPIPIISLMLLVSEKFSRVFSVCRTGMMEAAAR